MSIFDLQLETERLILRPPQAQDFEPWAAFIADEEAAKHIGGVQPRSIAWRSFATVIGAWHLQGFSFFSVIEKSTGNWVGRVGPWQPEGWPGTEVGWSVAREHWGKGFAPEAAIAAIDWAFDTAGWSEVIHTIAEDNAGSKVVAAKVGSNFLRMGWLPAPHDAKPVEIWGQSREEWIANRNKESRA
jgi:RimJ/RimL family protein N-acetyltransferase